MPPALQQQPSAATHTVTVDATRKRILITRSRRLHASTEQPSSVATTSTKHLRKVTVTRRKLHVIPSTVSEMLIESKQATDVKEQPSIVSKSNEILPESAETSEPALKSTSSLIITITTPSSSKPTIIALPTPILPTLLTYTTESTYFRTITTDTTRQRTYTYVVTRQHDDDFLVTSSTAVREQIKPVTETLTLTSTVTLRIPIVMQSTQLAI